MIKELKRSTEFKRDYKRVIKRGCLQEDLEEALKYLIENKPLPKEYWDHPLNDSKYYKKSRECHIYPDWLLIYKYTNNKTKLELIRTGSHSELYR